METNSDNNINTYSVENKNEGKVNLHRDFLRNIYSQEEDRLSLIENKTFQIISQTGIIFALLSLFIPVFIENISDLNILVQLLFILILVTTFFFYLLTINSAIKNFHINKYKYARSSAKDVIKYQDKSINQFLEIEIKNLISSIELNSETNNRKASNLIQAYKNFRYAIVFTGVLGVFLCIIMLFIKPSNNTIIENHINIENYDSIRTNIKDTIIK